MGKIFLISSNICTEPYPVYPLGMAVIAGSLKAAGHQIYQFDWLVANRSFFSLEKKLKEFSPDFVGVSIRNIDNVDSLTCDENWYLTEVQNLVRHVREITSGPIILGGPGFSLLPEEILEYVGADYGVVGEGEEKICYLIDRLEKKLPVDRIIRKNNFLSGIQFGRPCLEDEYVNFYVSESGLANLQTKRGCPYNCAYCSYPFLEGKKIRARPAEAVISDLERMVRDYKITHVFFTDSVFNDHEGHFLLLAEELVRKKLPLRWCAFFRPSGLKEKDLILLKRAGLHAMELGTDASTDRTLKGLNKNFVFEEVVKFNNMCVKQEIPCAHFIIFGGPGETDTTVEDGLKNIEKLKYCVVFAFSGIRILPETELYKRAVREGIIQDNISLLKPVFYFSPHVNIQTMNEKIKQAFRGRRDRIFPPSKGQAKMAVLHRFGFRGILWDTLISFPSRKSLVCHEE